MLPAVIVLLLVGAAFIVIAWSGASDAVDGSRHHDEARAMRLSRSVQTIIERQWRDMSGWADEHRTLIAGGRQAELTAALRSQVDMSSSSATAAWLVVRADGSVIAVAEATPGRLAASSVVDDLRALGRTAAMRGTPLVGDRLKIGAEYAYGAAVPVELAGSSAADAAVVAVTYLQRTSIGAFIGAGSDKTSIDEAALIDANGRALLGQPRASSDALVQRPVAETDWSIEFPKIDEKDFLPGWAYPGFVALLVIFACAYGIQELNRRRLRQEGDRRAGTSHALYELASHALHAESVDEQVEQLAVAALDLADVDDVRVTVTAGDGDPVEYVSGAPDIAARTFSVPIAGPRGVLGELVVGRDDVAFDESEGWGLQTAAALVGAAIDTLASLESERAVAAELQRLDELRSNLLATVAHELLSPLTAVKGVLGLLSMQDDLGERGREFVGVATERTDRLVELIRDLFDCSLLETGQLDIKPTRQRADELLEAALGAQAAARPGELRLSATPNLMITVDPVRFDQLVNNLVTNAFRHGEAPVEVAVRPADGGTFVVVSDEGPGIPASDREEIFGKFWQGSSGPARTSQGAGLGLSLVQGLVRVHGGDITIDSTHADGRGARFTAYFPDAVAGHGVPGRDGVDETPIVVER